MDIGNKAVHCGQCVGERGPEKRLESDGESLESDSLDTFPNSQLTVMCRKL